MPKRAPKAQFEFHQIEIQDEGGWCAGISAHLAALVTEDGVPSPQTAYSDIDRECAVLWHNRSDRDQQKKLRNLQKQNDEGSCFGVANSSGSWVYNFTGSGVALLNLDVSNSTVRWMYGAWFQWRGSPTCFASMNHAGLAVWDSQNMFVFDPNVGGSLWTMSGASVLSVLRYSGPALIDEALEYMYANDSLTRNRDRRAVVRSAVFVKPKRKLSKVLIV